MLTDAGLTEEEVLLEKAASQDKDAEMAVQRATLVLRLREGINSLARVLKVIEVRKIKHNMLNRHFIIHVLIILLTTAMRIYYTEW